MGVNRYTIAFYWQHIRQHKVGFFVALVAIPGATLLLDTILPYFLSQAIGGLTEHNRTAIEQNIVIAAWVGAGGVALNALGFQVLVRHESRVRSGLLHDVFSRLLAKDFAFFVNEKVGALTSRYIDFVRAHLTLQDLLVLRTLGFSISVGTGLVIVAMHSPLLAGILAGLIVLIMVQVRVGMKIRGPYRQKRKKMIGDIHGKVADALTNNLTVKTFANEHIEQQRLAQEAEEFHKVYLKDLGLMSAEGSLRLTVMVITQVVAMSICAGLVLEGHMELAIAIFALTYLQRIAAQLFSLGEMINGYDQALLDASPMSEILAQDATIQDVPGAHVLHNITPTVEFKKVSYAYGDSKQAAVRNFSLAIKPGERIGLVGHSGAGKTTITNLLLRFADVTSGTITVGGHDVRAITQASLRRAIAYVPQEPMLFHRTLRENIAYARPHISMHAVRKAAKQAHALEFIAKLPHKFDTLVGERGVKLSGGQRQRIAIARAILKDAPILVLDEATSALDSESEQLIQDALWQLMKGRTAIVIAHRLSTIQRMDRIIVMHKGTIAEQGTHKQLLAHKGIYAKLWARQSGGFIED